MPSNYKSAGVVAGTNATTLYTCPTGRTALARSIRLANNTTNTATATLSWTDSSAGATFMLDTTRAVYPVGAETVGNDGDIVVLEPGDTLHVTASDTDTIHATAAILELS